MKNYTITVNGNVYDVTVEEGTGSTAGAAKAAAPKAAAPKAAAPAGAQGAVKVNAPMPGKILKVNVNAGAAVKKGDVLLVLEAMKMENEICAPQDGTVATVECAAGDSVESGKVLVSMN
jgi:biotin carboxyl carrier protein